MTAALTTPAHGSSENAMLRRSALCITTVGLLFASSSPLAAAEGTEFAVVDVFEAMNATGHWKSITQALEKEKNAKQALLETKQRQLKEKKEQIDAQKAVSDAKTIQAREEALLAEAQTLTQEFMGMQQELTMREQYVTEQMLARIEAVVREIAAEKEVTFVFDTGRPEDPNVLFRAAETDLTKEVVTRYEIRFKDKPLELER